MPKIDRKDNVLYFMHIPFSRKNHDMKNKNEKLKAAMIGIGDITFLHQPAYMDFDHAELYAICDVNKQLVAQRKKEWGVQKTFTDYVEMLKNPQIDIVEVNTPHHLHKRLVIDALKAGKHVACQKPIAPSISDATAMVEAAKTSAGQLRIIENFVFYPPYLKAKELVEGGEIGEILTIRFKLGTGFFGSRWIPLSSELWHLVESDNGMGQAVFDDGYHKLSMAIHLVGPIQAVMGFIDRTFFYADEPAQLIWQYKNRKTLGSFDIALAPSLYTPSKYFPADERIDIVGTKGIINLSCCTGKIFDGSPLVLYKDGARYCFDDIETDWAASFINGIREFPLAIKEKRQALISGERATDIIKFAYALIVGAKLGIEIRPDEVTDELVTESLGLKKAR